MPTFQRAKPRTGKDSSASLSRGPETKRSESDSGCSLAQARIDRISRPTTAYFRSYCKWFSRIVSDRENYPTPELIERAYELGAETPALERAVRHPPDTLPAAEWEQAEDRLQRLWGQQKAIEEALKTRQARDRSLSRPRPSSGSPPTVRETEPDPFAGE